MTFKFNPAFGMGSEKKSTLAAGILCTGLKKRNQETGRQIRAIDLLANMSPFIFYLCRIIYHLNDLDRLNENVALNNFSDGIRFAMPDWLFNRGLMCVVLTVESIRSQGIILDGIGCSVNRSCFRLRSGLWPRLRNTCLSFRLIITS